MRRLSLYFFNGLLILLPIAGTVYLLQYLYRLLNELGLWLLERLSVDMIRFPGIGLLFLIGLVLLVGIIGRLWIAKKLITVMEAIIERIPLVKGLYGTLKDTIHSFIGEKKSFDTVVFVEVAGSKRIGFLTVKTPIFKTKDGREYLGVYFPQSYQFAGDLHWFERDQIEVLDLSVDEALKMVVSGGLAGQKMEKSHLPK